MNKQSEIKRSNQKPKEAIRNQKEQSETKRSNQNPKGAIRNQKEQSEIISFT
jgi:ribosomal protein S20